MFKYAASMLGKTTTRRAVRTLIGFAIQHRRPLFAGLVASVGVVAFRVALPWPLRGLFEVLFLPRGTAGTIPNLLPEWASPVLWLGAVYVVAALGVGCFEMLQRVQFVKFAGRTAQDFRHAAVREAAAGSAGGPCATAELIAWTVGDVGRIKSGISSLLVHGVQGALLFSAVSGLLLFLSAQLGILLAISGLMALAIGLWTSLAVARRAEKHFRKEGEYAVAVQRMMDHGYSSLELSDGRYGGSAKEAKTTRTIGLSSMAVHVLLALTVALAMWLGCRDVKAGTLQPGALFLFVAYATTIQRSMVKVGRHAARSGAILACVERLGTILTTRTDANSQSGVSVPLLRGLRLENVKLSSARNADARPRLRRTDLFIESGSRVAVVGSSGSGKSSLMHVVAGVEEVSKGKVFWDDAEVTKEALQQRVAFFSEEPVFPSGRVMDLLRWDRSRTVTEQHWKFLRDIGAARVLRDFPCGLEEEISSRCLTKTEARTFGLAAFASTSHSDVWVLDNPVQGLRRKQAENRVNAVLEKAFGKTIIIALSQPIALKQFDRLILLRRGRVEFDGKPEAYLSRSNLAAEAGDRDGQTTLQICKP